MNEIQMFRHNSYNDRLAPLRQDAMTDNRSNENIKKKSNQRLDVYIRTNSPNTQHTHRKTKIHDNAINEGPNFDSSDSVSNSNNSSLPPVTNHS